MALPAVTGPAPAAVLLLQGRSPCSLADPPRPGGLRQGERVPADDGACPATQVREIMGGSKRNETGASGQPIRDGCVSRR
jgi:hypothetical protein